LKKEACQIGEGEKKKKKSPEHCDVGFGTVLTKPLAYNK
jgi:hypothetical protein